MKQNLPFPKTNTPDVAAPSQTGQGVGRPARSGVAAPLVAVLLGAVLFIASLTVSGSFGAMSAVEAREAPAKSGSSATDWREVSGALDQVILDRLTLDGVEAAGRSDDAEFLRRVYLDLVGTVPTPEEVEAFSADKSRTKRRTKIDELIASDAYAENWATWWFRNLTGLSPNAPRGRDGQGGRYLAGEGGRHFHEWLSKQMSTNRPYNEVAEDLITAVGRTDENGAAGYMARWEGNANNMAGAVSKNFLGVQIQCAQCHDHIYETAWKQDDFKGMAAFFAGTRARRVPEYQEIRKLRAQMQGDAGKAATKQKGKAKGGANVPDLKRPDGAPTDMNGGMPGEMPGGMDGEMDGEMSGEGGNSPRGKAGSMSRKELAAKIAKLRKYANIVDIEDAKVNTRQVARFKQRLADAKRLNEQQKERFELMAVTPKFWLSSEAADVTGLSRRYLLARWITHDENPYFARALVNKLWAALMGRGIVSPADDFNSFNAPSHPEVLDILAEDFRANGYDLKRTIRILVNTETYQRTSRWTGAEDPDAAHFAKAPVRPLNIEQLYFSLVRATGMEKRLDRASRRQGQAIQRAIFATFSFVFDDDEGKEEQDFAGSIPQGLFLMNGELLQRALSAGRELPSQQGRKNRKNRRQRMRPAQSGFEQLLRDEKSPTARVERIYLQAYGRKPAAEETRAALAFVGTRGEDRQAWEDFFWAILNSAEFMTNH